MPADAWVAVAVDGGPGSDGETTRTVDTALFLLEQARRMGIADRADPQVAAVLDVLGTLPAIIRHPYAAVVLDADARPLGAGDSGRSDRFRLNRIRGAVIARTEGSNAAIEARLQHLLNLYTNSSLARCETVEHADGSASYRLSDSRLPEWAVIEWGAIGGWYVLALGTGAYDTIEQTLGGQRVSLVRDPWFVTAHEACRGPHASVEWTIRLDSIRRGLRPVMAGKPGQVITSLGLGDVERGLWAIGLTGRAVPALAIFQTNEGNERQTISRAGRPGEISGLVPVEATEYAIVEHDVRLLVHQIRDAYLASRSEGARANLTEAFGRLETELGISVDRDLLHQLGSRIIIHNEPPHPLGLPLMRTILVEISGSVSAVRTSLDRLGRWYANRLARPDSDWMSLRLEHGEDGVWYLRAGIYGPAIAVTDRWVVIGYSPVAVRQNLAMLNAPRGQTGAASADLNAEPNEH